MGVALSLMRNHSYCVIQSGSIDIDLYGILLIPERVNSLLSEKQNMIATKLVEKHPIIYEEGRCDKCRVFSISISNLNTKIKLYDSESKERNDISKQITKLNKKNSIHRLTHEKLSSTKIDQIAKDFNIIRDSLCTTTCFENKIKHFQQPNIYIPPQQRQKANVKNIFNRKYVVNRSCK
jgi:hypothetical protein